MLGVFVYHLSPGLLPGGFVGVDVFFVISGFLITSIVVQQLANNKFSLGTFFRRRISRIAPQAFLVSAVVLLIAPLVYDPEDAGAIATAAAAAAVSLVNVKFALTGSYFEFQPDTQPVLHYWSLSVEEQFYLLYPIFLMLVWRGQDGRKRALLTCGVCAAVSLALCVAVTSIRPPFAFYLLPMRAWEMLSGCMFALLMRGQPAEETSGVGWAQLLGLVAILASFFLVPHGDSFPGFYAVLPVVGAVMLLRGRPGRTESLLAHHWMVYIGKRSYALYLWHWPVFCLVDYRLFMESEFLRVVLKVVISCGLAGLTYRFFEEPVRRRLNRTDGNRVIFGGFAVVVAITCVAAFLVRRDHFNNVNTKLPLAASGGEEYLFSTDGPRVVLAGDSNAGMYGKAMIELAEEFGWRLNILAVHSTDPLPGDTLWENTDTFLRQSKPDIVVFVASWGPKRERVTETLADLERGLKQSAGQVVLIKQQPILPGGFNRDVIRNEGYSEVREDDKVRLDREFANTSLDKLRGDRLSVVSTEDLFLDASGAIRFVGSDGKQLFRDRTHVSYFGAQLVKTRLRTLLQKLLAQ